MKCGSCLTEVHDQSPIDYMGDSIRHKNRSDCLYAARAAERQKCIDRIEKGIEDGCECYVCRAMRDVVTEIRKLPIY